MATNAGAHISDIRNLIKQVQDDSHFTDRFLFSLLSKAKAYLMRQKLLKYNALSEFNYLTFCIQLEEAKAHDCDCVAYGCTVLKSKFEIPKPIRARARDLIRVETLGGKLIPQKTEEQLKYEKYDDVKGGKIAWSLRSQHIIIWNDLNLKAVQVSGLWEDVSEWADIHLCYDDDGNPADCYDIYESEFGLDEDLSMAAYQMVLNALNVPLQLRSDMTGDVQPEIKG